MDINSLKSAIAKLYFIGTKLLDNFIFYGGKIAGRIIFPALLIVKFKQYVNHQSYYPECELKSKFRIFLDQLFYILRTGEINQNYFVFGFDRKTKNDFNNYVPWLTFTHARNTKNQRPSKSIYDPYNYICLLRDKFIFEACCKRMGINTPSNIGLICEGELYLFEQKTFMPLDAIQTIEIDAFCKRNVSYGGGGQKML